MLFRSLTNAMGEWFLLQGGLCWAEEYFDHRGNSKSRRCVQFGKAKTSHHMMDGSNNVLVRFDGQDASVASIFILKFYDEILNNNIQDAMEREY